MKTQRHYYFFFALSISFFHLTFLGAQPLSASLQADFDFNDGSLSDQSPNMIPGNGMGALSTDFGLEGNNLSAFHFDGLTTYVDCGLNDRNISDQLSISAWFKTTSSAQQIIVSKFNEAEDAGYLLGTQDGFLSLGGRDGSNTFYEIIAEDGEVNDGEWHHAVGVINGSEWQLYLDCELVGELGTGTAAPQLDPTGAAMTIGKISNETGNGEALHFDGVIDNVRLYNLGLAEEQLTEISAYTCPVDGLSPNLSVLKTLSGSDPVGARTVLELPSGDILLFSAAELSNTVTSMLVSRCNQAGSVIWTKSLAGSGMEIPRGAILTSDGGYAIIGLTTSGSLGAEDISLIKLDSGGNLLWSKVYGGSLEDRGFDLLETSDNGLLLCGSTRSFGSGQRDGILIKIDQEGAVLWTKTFGGSQNDIFEAFQKVSDTEIVLMGITVSYGSGITDFWVVTVTDQGSLVSSYTYGTSADDNAGGFVRTNDGGFIVAGHTTPGSFGGYDGYIFKIDATRAIQWAKVMGGSGTEYGRAVAIDQNQHVFFSGTTASSGAGLADLFLAEIDPDGALIQARTYGLPRTDESFWVGQGPLIGLANNRLLMLGTLDVLGKDEVLFANFARDKNDVCLGKNWAVGYNTTSPTRKSVTPAISNPTIQMANLSFTTSPYQLESNYLTSEYCPVDLEISATSTLCTYQASNDITTTGLVDIMGNISLKAGNSVTLSPGFRVSEGSEFSALIAACNGGNNVSNTTAQLPPEAAPASIAPTTPLKLFPNPARSAFTVQITMQQAGEASLWLQDASGKTIRQVFSSRYLESGSSNWEVPIHDLPVGMYLVRFISGKEIFTEKLLKLD